MVTAEQVRQCALGLPEAFEADHHGRPSFRVAGKIFATLWDEQHLNVMLDEPSLRRCRALQGATSSGGASACAPCRCASIGPT